MAGVLSENVQTGILLVQIFSAVSYLLLFLRVLQHEGLISTYDPQQRFAEVSSNYLGPGVGLGIELVQILTYTQVSKLLFAGITFDGWEHSLSQLDVILLSLVALVMLVVGMVDVASRLQDTTRDNIAEVVAADQMDQRNEK